MPRYRVSCEEAHAHPHEQRGEGRHLDREVVAVRLPALLEVLEALQVAGGAAAVGGVPHGHL